MDGIEVPECEDKWLSNDTEPCRGDVRLTYCPYSADLYNEIVPVWLCEFHEDESAAAI